MLLCVLVQALLILDLRVSYLLLLLIAALPQSFFKLGHLLRLPGLHLFVDCGNMVTVPSEQVAELFLGLRHTILLHLFELRLEILELGFADLLALFVDSIDALLALVLDVSLDLRLLLVFNLLDVEELLLVVLVLVLFLVRDSFDQASQLLLSGGTAAELVIEYCILRHLCLLKSIIDCRHLCIHVCHDLGLLF